MAPRLSKSGVDIEIKVPGHAVRLKIPSKELFLLVTTLGNMTKGKSNAHIQSDEILSTQQAADLLNVSPPYL